MKYQSKKTGAIIETDCELGDWVLLKEEVKKEAPKKEKKAKK